MLVGGLGADTLSGGSGWDTASYSTARSGVIARLDGGKGAGDAAGDRFVSIENLTGSNFSDTLVGSSANNVLNGGAGNDMLVGGRGNDLLVGGLGADTLSGGSGWDTASYSTARSGVIARLDGGKGAGDAAGDRFVSIENLTGSNFSDTLVGSSANNVLNGGAGNDMLVGGRGNDLLVGGLGADTLLGGSGADRFVFSVSSESSGSGIDRIGDFQRGQDKIDVSSIVLDTAASKDADFMFIGAAAFSKAVGEIRMASGAIHGDVDGDGVADFSVLISGVTSLATSDFIL